jgi:imidazolonepropionase-like amidohydrolase/Tol biopolymer transport system component
VVLDVATAARDPLRTVGLANEALDEPAWSPDGRRLLVSGPWRGGSARALLDGPPGARILEVDVATGATRPLTAEGVAARAPAWSPDGRQFAYFASAASGGFRLFVQAIDGGARAIATDPGIEPRRVRWSPDGRMLYFVARGRLRRVSAEGGASVGVPFDAELRVPRPSRARRAIRFPDPRESFAARGFTGLTLAPDGRRFALLVPGTLWVVDRAGRARAATRVPPSASGLAWSPDGRRVVWSAGPREAEDLWVTDVATGESRRVTGLPGSEGRAAWSPDGAWIAFAHWPRPESAGGSEADDATYVRLVAADARASASPDSTRNLGALPWSELAAFASSLQWTPDGDTILAYGMDGWPVASRACAAAELVTIDARHVPVRDFPCRPSHIALGPDGALLAIEDGVLTHRPRTEEGWGEPDWRGARAALYPTAASDGSILFVSGDGIRLRAPGGRERRIGKPLRLRAPASPPLLLRNVRIAPLDEPGAGAAARADVPPRDVLIANGRILRIAPAGTLRPPFARVLDAEGRWALPGLIDAHTHFLEGGLAVPRAALFHGVTTVREMWHPLAEAAAYRDAVAAGAVAGARIVVSGPPVYPFPTGVPFTSDFLWIPVDSATTDRGLTLLDAFGAGHVKMRYVQSWSGGAAFVRAAHARGLAVGGHCAHALPVVLAGIDTHEHLDGQCGELEFGVRDDLVQIYRAAGVTVVPVIDLHFEAARTARDTTRLHAAGVAPFMTPGLRMGLLREPEPAAMARLAARGARARYATRAMHTAGVRIAAGADASMFPGGIHRELEALVEAGLSPAAVLRAATRDAAAVLGVDRDIGRLERGFRADILIVDGDPLADIRATRRIWAVVQDGRPIDRDALRVAVEAGPR